MFIQNEIINNEGQSSVGTGNMDYRGLNSSHKRGIGLLWG